MSQLLQTDEIAWLRQQEWLWHGASGSSMAATHPATHGGRGSEPEFMRRYQPGDDIRWVDWAATLRLQRAMVRQPHPMQQSRLRIVLDTSASMTAFPQKWRAAVRMVAALGVITISQLNAVQLIAGQQETRVSHLEQWIADCMQLYDTPPVHPFEFPEMRVQPQPLILCSDLWHAEWQSQLHRLAQVSHHGIVIHLLDVEECTPAYTGEITLVDSETGQERTLTIDAHLSARYRDALQHHLDAVRATCQQYGITYHLVDSQQSLWHTISEVCQ